MPNSYYQAHRYLNVLRAQNLTAPTAVYVGLFTTMPGRDGSGGVECTTGTHPGYARQVVKFDPPATGKIVNTAKATMIGSTASAWINLRGFGIWDAASGGNLLGYEAFPAVRSYGVGQEVAFAAGELQVEH